MFSEQLHQPLSEKPPLQASSKLGINPEQIEFIFKAILEIPNLKMSYSLLNWPNSTEQQTCLHDLN